MEKVFKANFFGMLLIIWGIIISIALGPIADRFNLSLYSYLPFSQAIVFLLPIILYFLITKAPIKETLKFNKIGVKEILIILLIAVLVQPIVMFLSYVSTIIMPNSFSKAVLNNMPSSIGIIILILGVIPGIFEELAFRGIILSGYENISTKKSAFAAGLMFAIMHFDIQRFLYTLLLGVLFVYLIRITDSIFSSIICHIAVNSIQMTYASIVIKNSANIKESSGSIKDLPLSQILQTVFIFLIIAAICSLLVILLVKLLKKIHENLENEPNSELYLAQHLAKSEISSSVEDSEEQILNWPLIVTIIIYIILVVMSFINM